MKAKSLASGLDHLYADRAYLIEKFTIMTYGSGTEEELQVQLNEWAAAGYLEILKPLATCAEIEPCIRLISFILPNANRDK